MSPEINLKKLSRDQRQAYEAWKRAKDEAGDLHEGGGSRVSFRETKRYKLGFDTQTRWFQGDPLLEYGTVRQDKGDLSNVTELDRKVIMARSIADQLIADGIVNQDQIV